MDEIEKAHPDVLNILLQVLEDGMITDAYGQAVDFKNSIVIMTSNIGSQHIARTAGKMGFQTDDQERQFKDRRDLVMAEVKRTLSPEFINRIDEVIVFDALIEEQLKQIARIMIERLNLGLEEQGIRLQVTDAVCQMLVDQTCQDRSYGARPLRRAIQRHIEDALSEALIAGDLARGAIEVYLDGERVAFRSPVQEASSPSPS
jgi:ATP-dependent Clp protease ATP-binding subunit ClpC